VNAGNLEDRIQDLTDVGEIQVNICRILKIKKSRRASYATIRDRDVVTEEKAMKGRELTHAVT
jgi:hypothetical protein